MSEQTNENRFPSVRNAFFIVLATLLLYTVIEVVWGGLPVKGKLLLLETLTLVPALIYVLAKRFDFREVFRWRMVEGRVLLVSGVIGLGVSIVLDEVDRLIQGLIPMPDGIQALLKASLTFGSPGELVVLILAVVVVAGFSEEMLFRGFFQGAVERTADVTRAVLVTAFVFAFIHFNPWWVVEILVLGVLLGVLAWRSDSIFPGVVVHGTNNALAVFFINAEESRLGWYPVKGHVSPILVVLGLGLTVWGFRVFYGLTQKEASPDSGGAV